MKTFIAAGVIAVTTAFATPSFAQDMDDELAFLDVFESYLDIAEQFVGMANRKDAAVFFAVEGIAEIHEERGEAAKAIPVITGALDLYPDDVAVRNVIRFKLRDLYRDTGQADKALAELDMILKENQ